MKDDQEFSDFVREHAASLLRTAYILTSGNRHAAEDLAQEALLKTGRQWTRVRQTEQPVAYSRRILINLHLDETRRRGPWRLVALSGGLTQDRGTLSRPEQDPDPLGNAVSAREDLREALRGLPARQRAAVVLRYYEGRDVAEIAELMGIGESSVRSAISRALVDLRSQLTSSEQEQHHAVEH